MAKATTASLYGAVEIIPESSSHWNKTRSAAGATVCVHRSDAWQRGLGDLHFTRIAAKNRLPVRFPNVTGFVVERLFELRS